MLQGAKEVVPQGPSGIVAVGDVTAQQAGQDHEERDEKLMGHYPRDTGYGEVRNNIGRPTDASFRFQFRTRMIEF